jgi:hypothetical protein
MGRKVRTSEGFVVDEESGEVVEEPLESESADLWMQGLCVDEESVERIIDSMVPGLVALLRLLLKKSLCSISSAEARNAVASLWSAEALNIVQKAVIRKSMQQFGLAPSVFESRAFDLAGLPGLAVYRCLRGAGYGDEVAVKVLEDVIRGVIEGDVHKDAKALLDEFRDCKARAVIRWVSRPLRGSIDVDFASQVLGARVRQLGNLKYVTARVMGLGVQITASKVDISSRANEVEKVTSVLEYLSRRLGVTLSKPMPMIGTAVFRLPFRVNLVALARHEGGEIQSNRVKIEREHYTALVYEQTFNMYIRLEGILDKIDSALAELLPMICTYAETQRKR